MKLTHRFRSQLVGGAAVLAMVTFSLIAAAKLNKTGSSSSGFKAAGPAGLNIEGKTSDLSVADDGTNVTITVPLGNITTGIELRDKHTKEYLETDKYPNATLVVARSALKLPDGGEGDAKGKLTVHGQTKDVNFHYSAKKSGDTFDVKGTTRININDFGIKTPTYLGVGVKPDVDVFANFQAKDN
ncbi:MAG: YceI family protein [Minicystis sp.]